MNKYSKLLAEYIDRHFAYMVGDKYLYECWVKVDESPSLDKLLNLEALVKMAIEEKRRELK